MYFDEKQIYHVFNQGNNRKKVFFQERNYLYFLKKMRKHLLPYAELLCYCLMPNHFHWLIYTKPEACLPSLAKKTNIPRGEKNIYQQQLSHSIGILLSSYTRAVNKQEERSGSLFRGKTKIKDGFKDDKGEKKHLLFKEGNGYVRHCFDYIHENPSRAGLVSVNTEWPFSSARDYAGMRRDSLCLCNMELAKKLLAL